jgi:hypothetical protein
MGDVGGSASMVVTDNHNVLKSTLSITTMSFTKVALYPANPTTVRGVYTRLSASKEKIVYTNGKTVFVSTLPSSSEFPE